MGKTSAVTAEVEVSPRTYFRCTAQCLPDGVLRALARLAPVAADDVGVDGEKCSEGMAQLLRNLDRAHTLAQ